MRPATFLVPGVLLVGCQEYNISSQPDAFGKNNPLELETPTRTDRVLQVTIPEVDVLWVVDNSCSMDDEQRAITANFPRFMEYFVDSGLDYHVGLVSTDMDDAQHQGKLQPAGHDGELWLDPDTPDPVERFGRMASLGVNGSGTEKGLAAAYSALELRPENDGFVRGPEAGLHVIVVSDEDDQSGGNPIAIPEFIEYMLGLKEDPELVTWSSVVTPAERCSGGLAGVDETPGDRYFDLTLGIGGIMHSICTDDWGAVLADLGEQAAAMRREFFLAELPVPGTVEVAVTDEGARYELDEGIDWEYDGGRNSVVLIDYVPPPFAEIEITYALLKGHQGG